MLLDGEEIFFIPYHDLSRIMVYAPLRSYVGVTSRKNATALLSEDAKAQRDGFILALKRRPYLSNCEGTRDDLTVPRIQRLTISLSERCNLKCIYCHAYREKHEPQTLPLTLLASVIETFCSYASAPLLFFEFHGDGEPTLYLDGLKHCIETIKSCQRFHPFARRIVLTTNGTFSVNVREYLKQAVDDLTISFDGYKEIQDRQRPKADGSSCYQVVYENIMALHRTGLHLTLRITVTPISLPHIESILQFLAESFPGIAVRVEPVRAVGRAANCFPEVTNLSAELATALDTSDTLRSGRVQLSDPYNGTFTMYDHIRSVGCSMLESGNWQVASDGSITCCATVIRPNPLPLGNCTLSECTVPNLATTLKHLQDAHSVTNRKLCSDCFCKYHCAGGCPAYPPDENGAFCQNVQEGGRAWLESKCGIVR